VHRLTGELFPQEHDAKRFPPSYPSWPPHSPDLTALDFPLCGFVKDNVYREKLQNVNELRGRIVRAADCVTNEMLFQYLAETEYRLDMCRATNGSHSDIC